MRNFLRNTSCRIGCTLFSNEVTYRAQSWNIPGISLSNPEIYKRGVKLFNEADTPDFGDLSVSLICGERLENWLEIREAFTNVMNPNKDGIMQDITFEIYMFLYDEKDDKPFLQINFKECRLNSFGDISFDTTSDDSEVTFDLSINYSFYTVERRGLK